MSTYAFVETRLGKEARFNLDAANQADALHEAEYVLNMDTYNNDLDATGILYRVENGQDVFIAKVGPLEFGGAR